MRFKMCILSSLLFLAFLAVTALCVNWADPSYDADAMFSENEEIISSPEITPWESRELQKNESSLDWTMPSTLSGTGATAKESRSYTESSNATQTGTFAEEPVMAQNNTTNLQMTSTMTEAINAQGNWFFTLNDSVIRDLALTLLQDGSDVYGSGKIKEGNSSMDVAASGIVTDSEMKLNLVSTNPIIQYKLNLTLDQDRASGDFRALCAGCENWIGTAEGQKTG